MIERRCRLFDDVNSDHVLIYLPQSTPPFAIDKMISKNDWFVQEERTR